MNTSLRSSRFVSSDEEEVCDKLIQLSFVKIVNSKHERGGAKLHKNMMILHLLQKARLEHRRSSTGSPTEMEFTEEFSRDSNYEIEEPDADDNDESEQITEIILEGQQTSGIIADNNDQLGSNEDECEENQYAPPLLRFVSVEEDEDDVSLEISSSDLSAEKNYSELLCPPDYDYVNLTPPGGELNEQLAYYPKVIVQTDVDYYSWNNLEIPDKNVDDNNFISEEKSAPTPTFTIISAKSKSKKSRSSGGSTDSGCSSGSSSSSSSSEEDEAESGDDDNSSDDSERKRSMDSSGVSASAASRRRRKRKHRSPSGKGYSSATKKTCSEADSSQLSGLISVFRQAEITENGNAEICLCLHENAARNSPVDLPSKCCVCENSSPNNNHGPVSCGAEAESLPSDSLRCSSLLELTCTS